MRRTGWWLPAVLISLAGFSAGFPTLRATTYVPMSDAELVGAAARIVIGRVVGSEPSVLRGLPATRLTIEVQEGLKGRTRERLSLVLLGGVSPAGVALRVPGLPRYRVGDRGFFFLAPAAAGGSRLAAAPEPVELIDLALGGFRENEIRGRRLVRRALDGAHPLGRHSVEEPWRDAVRFARWIADRARGRERAADYVVASGSIGSATDGEMAEYAFLDPVAECGDHARLRWFVFDEGGGVAWRSLASGQPGIVGGGFAEVAAALDAWSDDPGSNVAYGDAGTVATGDGCDDTVRLADPNDEIAGAFTGRGVVAIGGACFPCTFEPFHGSGHHRITGGFVVTQNGLESFFGARPDRATLAAEIFAHELGHTLGLEHTDDQDALMWKTPHQTPIGATLRGDDAAGLRVLYGAGAPIPAAPSALAAVAASSSEIDLTWADTSAGETGFLVERLEGDGFHGIETAPANETATRVGELVPATPYIFRLRALGESGNSEPSNTASATTLGGPVTCGAPPSAPLAVAVTATSSTTVRVSWLDASSDETGFVIERDALFGWAPVAVVAAGQTIADLGGLLPRQVFSFRVRAQNAQGLSLPSAALHVRMPRDPGPPPPAGEWITSSAAPGLRFKVKFTSAGGRLGRSARTCLPQTVCVTSGSGDRTEILIRILPNRTGTTDWLLISRFQIGPAQVWAERVTDGVTRFYELPLATGGSTQLPGILDPEAFP